MISSSRTSIVALLLTAISIAVSMALGYAQTQSRRSPIELGSRQGKAADTTLHLVLSGPDIGFRVDGHQGQSVVGRVVVRINGQWVDVETAFAPKVMTTGR